MSRSLTMVIDQAIAELSRRSEDVPVPLRLPSVSEVEAVEREVGISFSTDYRRFLLEASNVVFGTLEPATVSDTTAHTHLPKVVASARTFGVPSNLLPICEDNADFYCLAPSGEVVFWSHNGATDERWQSLAEWISLFWIGERA